MQVMGTERANMECGAEPEVEAGSSCHPWDKETGGLRLGNLEEGLVKLGIRPLRWERK